MARATATNAAVRGKVVAITGGANGIGKEIARRLSEAGALVVIGDRDEGATAATAAELDVLGLPLDVTSTASFQAFLGKVATQLGPIDVFVNNAGLMWVGAFADEPESATTTQIEVNLGGVIRGVKLVTPAMTARGTGHIITIASAASLLAPAGLATYAASKHGVLGYLKAARVELRRSGVHLTAIMPLFVDTRLAGGTATGVSRLLQPGEIADAIVRAIARPRFQVSIPGYLGPVARIGNALPRLIQDGLYRVFVPNQITRADQAARASYQARFPDTDEAQE